MEKEIWKPIKDFKSSYEVSNLGNVRSIDRYCIQKNNRSEKYNHIYKGKVLKQFKNNAGYMQVQLSYQYKSIPKRVHRLVAEAFISNPFKLEQVNHKDGNKLNNNVNNLEWCTKKYNMQHAYDNNLNHFKEHNKKTAKPIIRDDGIKYKNSYEAAKELNVSVSSIRDVLKGRIKTCKGYNFNYL